VSLLATQKGERDGILVLTIVATLDEGANGFSPRNWTEAAALICFVDAHRCEFGVEAICRTLTWAVYPGGGIELLRGQTPAALRSACA
jgi:hypothetical protein